MVKAQLMSELEAVIEGQPVDEVFIALPRAKYNHLIETIVSVCEEQGIIVRVQTAPFALKVARWRPDELDGKPFVTIQSGPSNGWRLIAKRLIDTCISAVFLLGAAPLLVTVVLLIKLDSPGPVFFQQERVG